MFVYIIIIIYILYLTSPFKIGLSYCKAFITIEHRKKIMGKNKETINHHNPLRHSNITGHVNYYKGY